MGIVNTTNNLWTLPDGGRVPIDEAEHHLLERLSRMERALGEEVAEVARFYEQTGRPLRAWVHVERLTEFRETPEWNTSVWLRLERLLGQAAALGSAVGSGPSWAGSERSQPAEPSRGRVRTGLRTRGKVGAPMQTGRMRSRDGGGTAAREGPAAGLG